MRIALLYTYTILAYTILYPFTFFNILIILALNTVGFKKAIGGVLSFWARASFFLIGKKLSVKGKDNLNKDRKYIILANHSSLFDIIGIVAIYPNTSFFGKAYLTEIPIFGRVLKVLNFIPMKSSDLRNTKQMVEQLVKRTENQTVVIFPEGTRTTTGELNTFRKGFLPVLKANKLDILPISLKGFYDFKPKNRFFINFSQTISAQLHTPLSYRELENLDDIEIINRVRSKIASAL
jgi:1-acyl-sn-glycerol-3-phosphate acyltransferase